MATTITTYRYGTNPQAALEGWDPDALGGDDYDSPRASALYEALGADPSDEEYTLALHVDSGRWGLFGLSVEGHSFAVEDLDAEAPTVTDEQIEALEREAGEAGDLEQAQLCRRALDGDAAARAECASAIHDAQAMAD